ncbi:MAG: metal ABC transporter substrate-binding protein [Aristaeellaceae bacterium]
MKKLISNMLLGILLFVLLGTAAMADTGRMTVVAASYPLYDIARHILGDTAVVRYIPEPDAQISADVVLCTENQMEEWVNAVPDALLFDAVKGIEILEGDYDAFTIPVNCMICASFLADTMGVINPEQNELYQQNLMHYIAEMGELDLRLIAATANHPRITCDDGSMAYFAREYGVEYVREGENLPVLSAYTTPSEEDMQLTYCQLMLRNLEKLEAQN